MTKQGIEVLEYTIQLHPNDSNLYDSLGEFYQSINNNQKAQLSYKNGLKIVENQKSNVSFEVYQNKKKAFVKKLESLNTQ